MEENKLITVVMVEPMKKPEICQIDGGLESMQKIVGGLIQPIYCFNDESAIVCNDEGKLLGLTPNRFLRDENGHPYDIICGTFFVVGLGEDNFTSLTEKQAEHYKKMYSHEMLISAPKQEKTTPKNNHER